MFVAPLLSSNVQIKIIYVQTDSNELWLPVEFLRENLKSVEIGLGENQLMRHLYLRTMLCYFEQGEKYKAKDNIGLANRCFFDAKCALEKAEKLFV